MLFTKVTFFIMYLDIFHPMRWLKISAYIGGVVTATFYGSMTVCLFIFATPGRYETWAEHQTTHLERLDLEFSIPQSAVGLVIDLYILVLVIFGVSRLKMPNRHKIGVMLVFMSATMYEFLTTPLQRCDHAKTLKGLLGVTSQYLLPTKA